MLEEFSFSCAWSRITESILESVLMAARRMKGIHQVILYKVPMRKQRASRDIRIFGLMKPLHYSYSLGGGPLSLLYKPAKVQILSLQCSEKRSRICIL